MVKAIILTLIVAASCATGIAQEVAYLDLTDVTPRTELRHPPAPPSKCNSDHVCTGTGGGSGSVSVACGGDTDKTHALQTSLQWMDRIEYLDGDRAQIEVQIQNVGESPIEIPWSPHLSDLQPSDETARFQADNLLVGLFLHWGEGNSESLGWIYLYGVPSRKDTMLTLLPGEWARIRGPIDIELDHADGFVLPKPGADQKATAESELQHVEYTPVAGGVGPSITNGYPRQVHGNEMVIHVVQSRSRPNWVKILETSKP
jgi:hypothetical protein